MKDVNNGQMGQSIQVDQVNFVEPSFKIFEGIWYPFKVFKGCLPQILLGPKCQTFRVLLSIYLNFCPGVAYKSVADKKSVLYIKKQSSAFDILFKYF